MVTTLFLSASAASPYLRGRWVPGIWPQTHSHTHTLHGHHFNLQEMIWAVLFTQDFLQLKGECARSISFSFLLDLFISCQLCAYVYYGNLLFSSPPLPPAFSPPCSENTITLAAPAAADADALNSISLCYCNVRGGGGRGGEGQVRRGEWGEKWEDIRGWEVWFLLSRWTDSSLPPPFFPSLEGRYRSGLAQLTVTWLRSLSLSLPQAPAEMSTS